MGSRISAQDLGIELRDASEEGLFKWLLASFLMGKRIQAQIAVQTYQVLVDQHKRDTPQKLANCSHRELVLMLGEGGYARYDESTAARLRALASRLLAEYGGKVGHMRDASANRALFEKRLLAFDGIGPKTAEIFMSQAAQVLF